MANWPRILKSLFNKSPHHKPPPHRNWYATPYVFFDFRRSHILELALALALISVAIAQCWVYLRQAEIMRENIEATVRPYVAVSIDPRSIRFHQDPSNKGQRLCVDFTVINTGKLPAYTIIQVGVDWETRKHPIRRPFAVGNQVGVRYLFEGENSGAIPACSEELSEGQVVDIKAPDLRSLSVGVLALYGKISSYSASSYDLPYRTRSCKLYSIAGVGENLKLERETVCPRDNPPAPPNNFAL